MGKQNLVIFIDWLVTSASRKRSMIVKSINKVILTVILQRSSSLVTLRNWLDPVGPIFHCPSWSVIRYGEKEKTRVR